MTNSWPTAHKNLNGKISHLCYRILAKAIYKILKFQCYFKKMYSCFKAITKFIIIKIFIMKILINYY